MTSSFVNFDKFNIDNLIGFPAESKTIPNSTNTYCQIPFAYNYGTDETPKIDTCYVQLPELTSTGIMDRIEEGKGTSHSMFIPLPHNDENNIVIDMFDKILHKSAEYMIRDKGVCKITAPNADMLIQAGMLKNPIYTPRDKLTNEPIPGKAQSFYAKLIRRGSGVYEQKTLFCDLKGDPIDWSLLYNVDLKFIPLIQFEKIYVGAAVKSIQFKIISAVVTEISARGTITRQQSTIQQIATSNPDRVSRLDAQISKLMMERQDILSGAQSVQTNPPTTHLNTQTSNQSGLESFLSSAPSTGRSLGPMDGMSQLPPPPSPSVSVPKIPQIPSFN